jgi:hypothetical protein
LESTIGNEAIKVAYIRTLPGAEFDVAKRLREECERLKPHRYALLKGFGAFDITLLYSAPSFDFHLTKAGPIKGILKSNLFLCFPYLSGDSKTIFDGLSNASFSGFSFLKIDPRIQHLVPQIEKNLIRFLHRASTATPRLVLGTLGWNEMILIITGDTIAKIFEELFRISEMMVQFGENVTPTFLKTFSFIGLKYKILPTQEDLEKGLDHVQEFLTKNPSLRKRVSGKDPPTVSIACEPIYAKEIHDYWKGCDFQVHGVLGKSDIVVCPHKQILWGKFLAILLYFRHSFASKVVATHTSIRGSVKEPPVEPAESLPLTTPDVSYAFSTLKGIFCERNASKIANNLFLLQSLLQDPIIGYAFQDMASYAKYIVKTGRVMKKGLQGRRSGNESFLDYVTDCCKVLACGVELRSYGTYGTVEEVSGRFSQVRGGAQRALLGLEFIPFNVLRRLGGTWEGFVIADGIKFFHINEVINVPTSALWDPQTWWALYHEIAHILVDNMPDLLGPNVPEIRRFLIQRKNHDFWMILLNELTAEIIGFELGFYGKYKLFTKVLWNHLKSIVSTLRKSTALDTYLFRSFFVWLFYNHFRLKNVSKEDWQNTDFLYQKMLDHIEKVEKITRPALVFPDKHFIAAKSAFTFKDLYYIADHLNEKILQLPPLGRPEAEIESPNTKTVVENIFAGRICWETIDSPEAVLFHIFKRDRLNFEQEIATILTFWHLRMLQLKDEAYGDN